MNGVSHLTAAVGLAGLPRLRKLVVAVIGGTVVLLGVALIVLPGPAFIVIPVGLAILATEFAWARRAIRRGQALITKARRCDFAGKARVFVGRSR
jgi:Putative transmembrane protein (PGPGW)